MIRSALHIRLLLLLTLSISHNWLSAQIGVNELVEKIQQEEESIEVFELTDIYKENFDSYKTGDSIARLVSKQLKEKGIERGYLVNEVSRTRILNFTGDLVEALKTLDRIEEIVIQKNDEYLKGCYYSARGNVYFSMSLPLDARYNYIQAADAFASINDLAGLKSNIINIGNSYGGVDQYDSALYYYDSAYVIEKMGVMHNSKYLKANKARVYLSLDKNEEALLLYKEIYQEMDPNDHYSNILTKMNLGEAYLKVDSILQGKHYLLLALTEAEQTNLTPQLPSIYWSLGQAYHMNHQNDSAYHYIIQAYLLRTNLQEELISQETSKIALQHEIEQYEQEKKSNQLKLENEKQAQLILWISLIFSFTLVMSLLFLYFRIKGKNIVLAQQNLELTKNPKEKEREKTDKEEISDKEIELIEQLRTAFHQEKIYMNPELTLDSLAKHLNTNRSYLSEAINKNFELSYSNLINKVRIEAARTHLTSREFDNFSIEGIAKHVGYKSVSSFNSAFKKITGITPSYFRKSANLN